MNRRGIRQGFEGCRRPAMQGCLLDIQSPSCGGRRYAGRRSPTQPGMCQSREAPVPARRQPRRPHKKRLLSVRRSFAATMPGPGPIPICRCPRLRTAAPRAIAGAAVPAPTSRHGGRSARRDRRGAGRCPWSLPPVGACRVPARLIPQRLLLPVRIRGIQTPWTRSNPKTLEARWRTDAGGGPSWLCGWWRRFWRPGRRR